MVINEIQTMNTVKRELDIGRIVAIGEANTQLVQESEIIGGIGREDAGDVTIGKKQKI
jgi:hypothetical protein